MTEPTEAKRDYYQILGVTRTATEQEIKNAFEHLTAEFNSAGKPKNIMT
jgi:preprotein translocase subunit Sec63